MVNSQVVLVGTRPDYKENNVDGVSRVVPRGPLRRLICPWCLVQHKRSWAELSISKLRSLPLWCHQVPLAHVPPTKETGWGYNTENQVRALQHNTERDLAGNKYILCGGVLDNIFPSMKMHCTHRNCPKYQIHWNEQTCTETCRNSTSIVCTVNHQITNNLRNSPVVICLFVLALLHVSEIKLDGAGK